jgi:hypothetical protein
MFLRFCPQIDDFLREMHVCIGGSERAFQPHHSLWLAGWGIIPD